MFIVLVILTRDLTKANSERLSCRLLAFRNGLVQRLRHLWCSRMFRQHNAHDFHKSRKVPGNPESVENETCHDEKTGGI